MTHTEQNTVWDLCSVYHDGRQLIITTRGPKVVYAYNAATDKCEWTLTDALGETKTRMSSQGIAADAYNHLFACDYRNSSIQKFSAIGSYLGVVLKEGAHGLGKPRCIRWCDSLQCLIVAHVKDSCYYISRIQDDSLDKNLNRFRPGASVTKSVDKNVQPHKAPNTFSTAACLEMLRKDTMQTEISEATANHSVVTKSFNTHVNDVTQQNGVPVTATSQTVMDSSGQRTDSLARFDLEKLVPANLPESPYTIEGNV